MRDLIVVCLIAVLFGLAGPWSTAQIRWISRDRQAFCIMPEVSDSLHRATAVFVGEVVEIIDPITQDDKSPPPGRFHIIKFKVEKSWKGVSFSHEFSVLSAQGSDEEFSYPAVHKGEKYLVFADPFYFDGVLQKGWSIITGCNRTKLLSNATEDLKRLGSAKGPPLDFRRRGKKITATELRPTLRDRDLPPKTAQPKLRTWREEQSAKREKLRCKSEVPRAKCHARLTPQPDCSLVEIL